ncbi:hypothetical protein [Clostridium oryzae]|uniref:Uncharacterized protein n=1 Tax=Clostridium oryzae TaxID=1450648 RepID=A0A1V4IBV6_9CLOT|nr:hypothetical protein [Clostridium oryzae]OPJ57426.1 hypothetical protein CLORY_41190 [Clostridium oryzae]
MESFLSELENKKVISVEDIVLLKQYIYKKHNDRSNQEKRQILTDAIHKILDRSIEGIAPRYIQNIKKQLLNNVVSGISKTVYMVDVFNVCINSKESSKDFLESIKNWVNLNVENKVSVSQIEKCAQEHNKHWKSAVSQSTINENVQQEMIEEVKMDAYVDIDGHANIVTDYEVPLPAEGVIPLANKTSFTYNFTGKWLEIVQRINLKSKKRMVIVVCASMIVVLSVFILVSILHNNTNTGKLAEEKSESLNNKKAKTVSVKYSKAYRLSLVSNLPHNFRYKAINTSKLHSFLLKRKSLLAKEPYFSTVINVAKEYNLNPNILFAVAGQEQGFVPKNKKHSKKIVNNPYNVYISWKKYNTNLKDSTKVACVSIINMCKNRPNEAEAFKWINKNYAEDTHWHKGVRSIFDMLEKYCSLKSGKQ